MRLVDAATASQVATAKANALHALTFAGVYQVTWQHPGGRRYRYVGMAPVVSPRRLSGSRIGIGARWIVNSPERWEQRAIGTLYRRPQSVLLVAEPDDHGVVRRVIFRPMTLKRFLGMRREIAGHRDLERVLVSDDLVQMYFWADWVPNYWVDQFSK